MAGLLRGDSGGAGTRRALPTMDRLRPGGATLVPPGAGRLAGGLHEGGGIAGRKLAPLRPIRPESGRPSAAGQGLRPRRGKPASGWAVTCSFSARRPETAS